MNNITKSIEYTSRLLSMLIDISTLFVISIPFIIIQITGGFEDSLIYQACIYSILFTLFICKDLNGGKSLGKFITNLKVVNIDGSKVSTFKLLFRNLFFIFWPIEIIFCIANPERRLGDIVLGTKIIKNNEKVKKNSIDFSILYIMIIVFIFIFILLYFTLRFFYISSNVVKLFY